MGRYHIGVVLERLIPRGKLDKLGILKAKICRVL